MKKTSQWTRPGDAQADAVLSAALQGTARGTPCDDPRCQSTVVGQLGIESTLRPRGRSKRCVMTRISRMSPFAIWLAVLGIGFQMIAGAEMPEERLTIHPHVFSLITCWPSDTDEPVVTEVNLDAVSRNQNQFAMSLVKVRGEWVECHDAERQGFERYRITKSDNGRVTVEFQSNGGGTSTSVSLIEFVIEQRELLQNGKPVSRRVLRVLSCTAQ